MRAPNIGAMNSDREIPSPCSPENEPLNRLTRSQAASARTRMVRTSAASFMSRIGRTWRQPTEACAYHVPRVPLRPNSSVIASV